ncbi:hypothetical protein HDU97_001906 [Phlyctochytrium planicorne]|nr:hypothetical protein HDU97_001906 [Phlyctochytrium planicorne]
MLFSTIAAIVASSLIAVQAAPALEPRSNYPPDYVVFTDCKSDGPVTVCSLNKDYNYPRLKVTYSKTGYLWAQGSPLSAWVSLNGVSDTFGNFTADKQYYPVEDIPSASYIVGSARDVQYCYHPTVGDNSTYPEEGQFRRCPVTAAYPLLPGGPTQGELSWFANPPTQKDLNLITPAKGKAWNVQVAIVNGKGNWDSKYSQNYRFTL